MGFVIKMPDWAISMVGNYRRELNIPVSISDDLIFTVLKDTTGMEQEDITLYLRQELEIN